MLKIQAVKFNKYKNTNQNRKTNKNTQVIQNQNVYKSLPLESFKSHAITFGNAKKTEEDYNLDGIDEIEDAMLFDEEFVYDSLVNKYAQDSFMVLSDKQPVIMQYPKEDENPELFLENLELVVKHGRVKNLGFKQDKVEFIKFNMGDYEPYEKDPLVNVAKKINKFKQDNPKKKPIVILRDFNALMKYQQEPLKLLYNDVLRKNNTIALDKAIDNLEDNKFQFDYTKYPKMIKSFDMTALDSKDYEYLLEKPAFIKKYVSNGKALHLNKTITDKVIEVIEENNLYDYEYTPVNLLKDIIKYRKLLGKRPDRIAYQDVWKAVEYFDLKQDMSSLTGDNFLDKQLENLPDVPKKPEPPKTEGTTKTKDEDKAPTTYEVIKNVKTRFNDIGGMFNVKKVIQDEFLDLLGNEKLTLEQMPSGILLEGAPGTGKTLLAKAIAGESKLPFLTISGSDFDEMYVGVGAQRVRGLFKEARKQAKAHARKMSIIFIDEAEGASGKRGEGGNREADKTLNAILKEMDGVKQKDDLKEKVIVIVATNRKDIMDKAFLRRFDVHATIDDPRYSQKARKEIIAIHTKTLPFENEEEKAKILENFAHSSRGMSGDEIAKTLKKAYRMTFAKDHNEDFIMQDDILEAKMRILAGIKTDMEADIEAIEKTVLHEAGHAINLLVMQDVYKDSIYEKKPLYDLDFITNEARGNALGTTFFRELNKTNSSMEGFISLMVTYYGGLSTEEEMVQGHLSGVTSDLNSVTKIAEKAVRAVGMGKNTGKKAIPKDNASIADWYKEEMKKDFEVFTSLAEGVSSDIIAFSKGFLNFYIQEFRNNPKMRTEIITGEKFKAMFNTWLEKENKKQEYEKLCKDIYDKIDYAKQNGSLKQDKIGYNNVIDNPYQYQTTFTTTYS